MNKSILGALALAIVIALGVWAFMGSRSAAPSTTTGETATSTTTGDMTGTDTGSASSTTYTLADIATHADQTSCWTTIEGKVYDLTKWIPEHPGGPAAIINNLCGKDGTAAFTAQHDHAERQQDILKTFYIGDLAQ